MSFAVPNPLASEMQAIGAASVPFTLTMAKADTDTAGVVSGTHEATYYAYVANAASWITQAASAPVATAGSGSLFVPANTLVLLDPKFGVKVAQIQDGASTGKATLTPVIFRG